MFCSSARLNLLLVALTTLGCLTSASLADSSNGRTNRYCRRAFLHSLYLSDLKKFPLRGNLCKRPLARVPKPIRETLAQVRGLNLAIDRALRGDGRLLKEPFELLILGNPYADLGSSSSASGISIGVLKTWSGGKIDGPSYVHEYGHLLGHNPNRYTRLFGAFSLQFLFQESIPDELALTVLGTLAPEDPKLHRFPWIGREPGPDKTYYAPVSALDGTQQIEQTFQFCSAVLSSALSESIDIDFCEYAMEYEVVHIETLDMSPFDPSIGESTSEHGFIDPHTIGLPIVSFLQALKKEAQLTSSPMLDLMVSGRPLSEFQKSLRCTVKTKSNEPRTVVRRVLYLPKIFDALRAKFSEDHDPGVYDKLWQDYGMELAMEFAKNGDGTNCN